MQKKFLIAFPLLSVLIAFGSCFSETDKRYVITDYEAVGDSNTLNTEALQSIIDLCASEGGGTIVVPEGVFLTGAVFFKQGVSLHLEKGGVLKGTVNPNDYKQIPTRWEGTEMVWTSALINFIDMSDFSISGEGTIDGSGEKWMERYPRYNNDLKIGRPRLIAVQNCSDVVVSDINLKNQACWGLFVLYSHDVLIKNLTITAEHHIISSDGIDIDSGKDIMITGCVIDVNDDCISIKSGKDQDGRRVNRPCEDVIIEKCHFKYGHGGVAMGSEMSGGIRNVEVRDCVVESDNWAPIRFKSQPSRGGVVENITYKNLELKNTKKAFEFNMAWRMVPPLKPPSDPLPVVRNIQIINVKGTVKTVGDMHGLPDSPVQGVTFTDCEINAETGFVIEHVEDLDVSGLTINVKEGEPIIYTKSEKTNKQ